MRTVTMLQVCSVEDEHDNASLVRRVQEMNNILQGVQAHYAESDSYNGNTQELRSHYNRVWGGNAYCSGKEFEQWWCSWVGMLAFEVNYIQQLDKESSGIRSGDATLLWNSYIAGLRQQVDNAVQLLQEVRSEVLKVMPELVLEGFPGVPPKVPSATDDEQKRLAAIRALADQRHHKDGELEFDPDAKVSEGEDNGAYVQGWYWVSFTGTELDKDLEVRDDDTTPL